MKFRSRLEKLPGPSAVAIGNFDGFHAGHKLIIETLHKTARYEKLLAVVLTFHPHPRLYFNHPIQLISTDRQRRETLSRQQPDYLFFIDFSSVVGLPAHDFVRDFLLDTLRMKMLVIGEDFRFGRSREGDLAYLHQEAATAHFKIIQSAPVKIDGCRVASSLIRKKLAAGAIREANRMLEKPYYIDGIVEKGAGRGKTMGFPTLNIATKNQILPSGVFHTRVEIGNRRFVSLTNIGFAPTFHAAAEVALKIETHIPGFQRTVYGKRIRLFFIDKIRDEKEFTSIQGLVEQIRQDITFLDI
ncbi:MAG TPA: riboflavin biosynthesis protein RibF [Patescibacteria group bacterium]|nr:riboflavin biosynthesis protein RibF [Patescibacteria group bacterium]